MYQAVLADAKFYEQLLVFDRDLAVSTRTARCRLCGGALHSRSYARKPRGGPAGLGREHAKRFSFSCAVDGCRKRATPPSLRFLGRHVSTPATPLGMPVSINRNTQRIDGPQVNIS